MRFTTLHGRNVCASCTIEDATRFPDPDAALKASQLHRLNLKHVSLRPA